MQHKIALVAEARKIVSYTGRNHYLTLRRNRTTLLILFAPHSTCQKWPGWGYPLLMITEPAIKRAVTFADGQNLFYAVREAFGYTYPNYDVLALSRTGNQGTYHPFPNSPLLAGWRFAKTRPPSVLRGKRFRNSKDTRPDLSRREHI